jgi:hypothetical protein
VQAHGQRVIRINSVDRPNGQGSTVWPAMVDWIHSTRFFIEAHAFEVLKPKAKSAATYCWATENIAAIFLETIMFLD